MSHHTNRESILTCTIQLKLHSLLVMMDIIISLCSEFHPDIGPPSGYRKNSDFTNFGYIPPKQLIEFKLQRDFWFYLLSWKDKIMNLYLAMQTGMCVCVLLERQIHKTQNNKGDIHKIPLFKQQDQLLCFYYTLNTFWFMIKWEILHLSVINNSELGIFCLSFKWSEITCWNMSFFLPRHALLHLFF